MLQKYTYYALFLCALPTISLCMRPDDPKRKDLAELLVLCKEQRYIGDEKRVCHDYAICTSIGKFGEFPPQHQEWYSLHNILKHFEKIDNPQKGDLVVYRTSSLLFRLQYLTAIQHTGLVYDTDMVESKWGTSPYAVIHPTFALPYEYGETVSYYRKKDSDETIYQSMLHKIRYANIKRFCEQAVMGVVAGSIIKFILLGLIASIKSM